MIYVLAQTTTPPSVPAQPAGHAVGPTDLSLLDWNGWGLEVRVGVVWLCVLIIAAIAVWWFLPWVRRKWLKGYRTKAVKLRFGPHEVEICPDTETRRVAHQAWVEIKSRKVGLPFEEEHDVIGDIYNSWYQLFRVLRELAKSIPADRLQDCEDTRSLVKLLMQALNEGLRPHLTKWQARFQHWYDAALANEDNKGKSPQEIQRLFPDYSEVVADLRKVNGEFVRFADSLEKIVKDGK